MSIPSAWSVVKACLTSFGQAPAAIAASLDPRTDLEARILSAQLDHVERNVRYLNLALPVGGLAITATVQGYGVPMIQVALAFLLVAAVCGLNEFLLARKKSLIPDIVAETRRRARGLLAMTLALTAVWCVLIFSMYHRDIAANRLFVLLILSGSLWPLSTMFATQLAAAAGALVLLSGSMFAVVILNSLSGRGTLLPVSLVYAVLAANHALGIHRRFQENRRLEQQRETLIASLRETHLESIAAREEAIANSKAKSEFLAHMSHELRTPLNAIIGFSEIMQRQMFGPLGDAHYRGHCDAIHSAGAHLLALIDDVLDMSKIEAGGLELSPEEIDLADMIAGCVALMRERAAQAGVTLQIEVHGKLRLLADRRAVKQILLNLISNAIKFAAGGRVRILAELRGAHMVLQVEDNGLGISAADLPRLGQPFVQARNHVGTSHEGTGLGLALVRALAERHGGTLRIESEEHIGTIVSVEFPADCARSAAA